MTDIDQVSQLEQAIYQHEALAVLFTRDDSAQSRDLFPRVRRLMRRFPQLPAYHVSIDRHPSAASEFLVYEVPTIIIYYHGTPAIKHVADFHLPDLRTELEQFTARLR